MSPALRFAVITDGTTQMGPGLALDEAAQRVAAGYRSGRNTEARVVLPVGGWRPLSHAETKALAYAAALEVAS